MGTELLHELRQAAKDGDDMGAHEAALLADGSQLAASTLTFFYAVRDRYPEIDRLLASDSARTRWGVVRALAESFREEHVDRLARALCDPDREVQKMAFTGLEDARKAGRTIRPSPPILAQLDAVRRADVAELVYLWTTTDTLCRICTNLGDIEFSGQEEGLRKEKRELVQDSKESFHCPICATRYHYDWSEHYADEFGSHGVWELRRLAPPVGTRSKEQLYSGLTHPLRRIQRECASELGTAALASGDVTALQQLFEAEKPAVRLRTASLLASAAAPIAPLVPVLRAMLTDPDDDVRRAVEGLLARDH